MLYQCVSAECLTCDNDTVVYIADLLFVLRRFLPKYFEAKDFLSATIFQMIQREKKVSMYIPEMGLLSSHLT